MTDSIMWHNFMVTFPQLYRWMVVFARYTDVKEAFDISFSGNTALVRFRTSLHSYRMEIEAPITTSSPGRLALYLEGRDAPLVEGFYRQEVWNRAVAEIAARELQPQEGLE